MPIDPSAIVSPKTKIGENVVIGAYCQIDGDVEIGDNCEIISHVVIKGETKIGRNNKIFPFNCIGGEAQHLTNSSKNSVLIIGDNNTLREHCTLHRGTKEGGGLTKIGNNNYLMVNTHIAHDCHLGDNNVIANNSSLGGHVHLGNNVILSGHTGVHQFCHIGDYAFIGRCAMVVRDVPPYTKSAGNDHKIFGVNTHALKKAGFSEEEQQAIKTAYRIFYRQKKDFAEAINDPNILKLSKKYQQVSYFVKFIKNSQRSVLR